MKSFLKKYMDKLAMWLGIIGGVLVIIGAIVQYGQKKKSDEETSKAKDDANAWNKKFDESQEELLKKSDSTKEKAKELANVYRQLAKANQNIVEEQAKTNKLQEETIKYAIGDGVLSFYFTKNTDYIYKLHLTSDSAYPIYDIGLTVYDLDKFAECKKTQIRENVFAMDIDCLDACQYIYGKFNHPVKSTGIKTGHIFTFREGINNIQLHFNTRHTTFFVFAVIVVTNGDVTASAIRTSELKDKTLTIVEERFEGIEKIEEVYWSENFISPLTEFFPIK